MAEGGGYVPRPKAEAWALGGVLVLLLLCLNALLGGITLGAPTSRVPRADSFRPVALCDNCQTLL